MSKQAFIVAGSAALCCALWLLPAQALTEKQQVRKECTAKWDSLKTANQTEGRKYNDFMKECTAQAQPTAAAPSAQTTATAAPGSARQARRGARKACDDRWKAEKPAIEASGKNKKDFMAECIGGTAAAPSGAPSTEPAAAARKSSSRTAREARKACNDRWKTEETTIKASGKKKKDFMAECLGGTAAAAPSGPAAATPSEPAASRKRASRPEREARKACNDRWKTEATAIQASGKKKKDFMDECLKGATTAAAPPSAPAPEAPKAPDTSATGAPPPAATEPAQPPAGRMAAPSTAAPEAKPQPRTSRRSQPAGANEFGSEAQAKANCPSDTVVWVNLDSKIYHFSGHADYGHTKKGTYMCERDTAAAGFRAAKNEKHP